MDMTTARAEVESWLRALAAPMAPIPAADVRAVVPGTQPEDAPAAAGPAPAPRRRDIPAVGGTDPVNVVEAPGERVPLGAAAPSGPTALAVEWPASVLRPGAGPAAPVSVLDLPSAPETASAAGSRQPVDHELGPADPHKAAAQLHDQRVVGAVGTPDPRPGRRVGRDTTPWGPPDAWTPGNGSWAAEPDTVAATVDAALAPLLPPPAVPMGTRPPDVVLVAADTVDDSRPYAGHDPADLADLLAGVLEDETRALGVLELEP